MQGAAQVGYEEADTSDGATGLVSDPLPAAHFNMTRIPCPLLVATKATCEPSSEILTPGSCEDAKQLRAGCSALRG